MTPQQQRILAFFGRIGLFIYSAAAQSLSPPLSTMDCDRGREEKGAGCYAYNLSQHQKGHWFPIYTSVDIVLQGSAILG
jgi:hypothetical protein